MLAHSKAFWISFSSPPFSYYLILYQWPLFVLSLRPSFRACFCPVYLLFQWFLVNRSACWKFSSPLGQVYTTLRRKSPFHPLQIVSFMDVYQRSLSPDVLYIQKKKKGILLLPGYYSKLSLDISDLPITYVIWQMTLVLPDVFKCVFLYLGEAGDG